MYSGMLLVLHLHLHSYVNGPLSKPSTRDAPANFFSTLNIAAGCVLGMFHSFSRKALNATVGFVDGKVKAAMNMTMRYIMATGNWYRATY
ncbi:hypothetical protein PoB_000370000 [Plakobranchus ocellatus]|uniref:Uncharacterized protein n=1 Tax=Plakobranchus ocellatus TaxID=259542 RepID=A0AAV3Y280_9GAST|nr:hypothetical protein PoB_000370000 [Plakobranchus ocellatus]